MLEEGPLVCARPGLPQSWGVWEADQQRLQGNAPLWAPYHSAQQFHKTQRPNLENSWGGGQNKWLRGLRTSGQLSRIAHTLRLTVQQPSPPGKGQQSHGVFRELAAGAAS